MNIHIFLYFSRNQIFHARKDGIRSKINLETQRIKIRKKLFNDTKKQNFSNFISEELDYRFEQFFRATIC
ncbi:hypothetical protein IQ66_18435 [Leptospira borgpetersenii serovar Ballum]|nr:hypothetical protein IQ66_18435 [Leptospira borgpetersenii serovar Ballum]